MTDAELAHKYAHRIDEIEAALRPLNLALDELNREWFETNHGSSEEAAAWARYRTALTDFKTLQREFLRLRFLVAAEQNGEPITLAALRYQHGMTYSRTET